MEIEEIKQIIIKKINQIDDHKRLNAILTILNTLENDHLSLDEVNNALETEDFSGYIKEWLKNM
jgi:hypothetical protein